MTIAELIGIVDELVKDTVYSQNVKLMFVNEVEGRIQHDVFRVDPDEVEVYSISDITNGTTLLLGPPFNQVYVAWMKAMYYWHQAEYNSYENEMAMFNSEFARLCRTVSEARAFGTSLPPVWQVLLPSRYLPGRVVLNEVSYDENEGKWASAQTFEQLTAQITQGYWPACKVLGNVMSPEGTLYLPLQRTAEHWLSFGITQEWHEVGSEQLEYVRAVLWIKDDGTIDWRYEET